MHIISRSHSLMTSIGLFCKKKFIETFCLFSCSVDLDLLKELLFCFSDEILGRFYGRPTC